MTFPRHSYDFFNIPWFSGSILILDVVVQLFVAGALLLFDSARFEQITTYLPKALDVVDILGLDKEAAHDLSVVEHDGGGRAESDGDEDDEEAAVDGQLAHGRPLKELAVVAPVHHLPRRPHS